MSLFQIIVTGIFIVFIVFAVLVFSGIIPFFGASPSGVGGTVILWGTLPADYLSNSLSDFNRANDKLLVVRYVQKNEETFDRELVEAIASQRGPDMILLPQDLIVRHSNKVFPISYEQMSVRSFKDTFIEEGELYFTKEGISALPLSVDPLILFWNRDIFNAEAIPTPPAFWDQFLTIAPAVTVKDEALNVSRSLIAFGEFKNVTHAKDIISMLILQAGNPITEIKEEGIVLTLSNRRGFVVTPAESVIRFYTEFSNPLKPAYSWNRSLPESKDFFVSNDLGVYIGYASEIKEIIARSPNLNFDVALVPQVRGSDAKQVTFGRMTGVAALRSSPNLQTALYAASLLSGKSFIEAFSNESGLPPVRRDLLTERTHGSFGGVLYPSALISNGWFDPLPAQTASIFESMIGAITSGRETPENAITRAHGEIGNLFKQTP